MIYLQQYHAIDLQLVDGNNASSTSQDFQVRTDQHLLSEARFSTGDQREGKYYIWCSLCK